MHLDVLTGQVQGEVVLPDSPEYDAVRKPAMARFDDVKPAAIVRCATPADVSTVIRFARSAGLPLAVRSGGHSVAGRSSTDGILVDVTPMHDVSVGEGVATVGAGARLGDLYDALYAHGVTIPAGCGPTVGIAGLTQGGGIGILGRRYGLTCDRLLRAEVVLADGRVVECDQHQQPDLFWALRGAGGGNFGVVTSLVFATVPAPDATVFRLWWPLASANALVETWQAWAPSAPDDIDATLRLNADSGAESANVELIGAVLGGEAEAATRLDSFVSTARVEPVTAWSGVPMNYPAAKRQLDDIDQHTDALPGEPERRGHVFTKSEFFRLAVDRQTIAAVAHLLDRHVAGARAREVTFMPWGGAYNAVATEATAFAHRSELFLVQCLLETEPDAPGGHREAGRDWLARSWSLLHPFGSGGVYPNFPDPDLPDWGRAYYGQNYSRLRRVKAAYDPDNIFNFHQSIPPESPCAAARRS